MKSDGASISVVILNFNGRRFAEQCIRSVLATDYPSFEVLVVDNASTDGSRELLRQEFGRASNFKLVHNDRNLGFAGGNNVGFKHSTGEVVVFLNVDTKVESRWLRELIKVLGCDESIGIAQCKMLSMDDPERVDSLGCYLDGLGFVYSWGSWYSLRPHQRLEEPFYAEAAAMAIRRAAVDQVLLDGVPFDPDYFFFYEDSDFSWRMRLRGFRVVLVPSSVVYHHRGYATKKVPYDAVFNWAKNRISTMIKNYGLPNLLRWVPLVILLEGLRAVAFLKSDPTSAYAKLNAILWCFRNLRRIWRKRVLVQSTRRAPDSAVVKMMLRPNFAALFRSPGE